MSQKKLIGIDPANIKNRKEFFDIINFYQNTDNYFTIPTASSYLLSHYINLEYTNEIEHNIIGMSKQEIYNELIKLYCLAIQHGDIFSKSFLAEQLLIKKNPYMHYDKPLGIFLMQIAMVERCSRAYHYFSTKSKDSHQKSIYKYWYRKSLIRNLTPYETIGECLNITYDEVNRKVIFEFD